MKQQSTSCVDIAEGKKMRERELKELQVRIARYRFLKRETTDPLAEGLLNGIVAELEADLKIHGIEQHFGTVASID